LKAASLSRRKLKPCADEADGGTEESEIVGAAVEVAGVDLRGAEVFDVVEGGELGGNLAWREEELEGFPGEFDARREGVERELLEARQSRSRLTVVEDKATVGRACGDVAQGRTEGFESEIGDDTQPREESGSLRVESSINKLRGEDLVLEVNRDEDEIAWDRDAAGLEEFAFPLLCRGVVDLKDAKVRVRVAVGEGVEACTEENVLRDSLGDGGGEQVFGVSAAGDKKSAKPDREGLLQFGDGLVNFGKELLTEYRDGDGVVEDEGWRVVELMRGAAHSDTESGSGREALLHCFCGGNFGSQLWNVTDGVSISV